MSIESNSMERSLPSNWYTADEIFNLEQEHIYSKEWVCAGRVEILPEVGDHKVLEIARQSIIVVRNESGKLRAFYKDENIHSKYDLAQRIWQRLPYSLATWLGLPLYRYLQDA